MAAGLFGKLPSKRDFVAVNVGRRFLDVWEPWIQGGVASARMALGERWLDAYNRAPLWRFWLGSGFAGEAMIGAFMASVDGVGRSFPLTLVCGEGEASLPPPELDANDSWCAAAEDVLLSALSADADLERVAAAAASLPPPALQPRGGDVGGFEELADGAILVREAAPSWTLTFRAARRFGHRRSFANQTFWWTVGGEDFPPLAVAYAGLPPPSRFADLLTGAFADAPPAQSAAAS